MTNIKKTLYIVIVSVFFIFSQSSIAQTNTLYFMYGIHQSNYLNPAYQSSCNSFVGLPALSGINIEAAHTGFSFKDLIHKGRTDSLIIDVENIKDKLGKSNYFMVSNAIPVLGLGFWIKNSYFTFDITNKTKVRMSYPIGLLKLTEGNGNYIGSDNPLEIKDFGPDMINYQELAFGLSKKITHRLFIGGRFKLLFGTANLESKKSNIKLYTEETTYTLRLETEFDYNISGPITVSTDSAGIFDGAELDDLNNSEIVSFAIGAKNKGIALDMGATYQFNDELRFYGSITDLGFIRWKSNTTNLTAKGSFEFSGLNLDSINSNSDFSEFDAVVDSLKELLKITQSNDAYNTFLNTNIYLGASYDISNFMNFGFLSRTTFYDKKAHQAFTLSANFKPVKWFSGTLSYSVANRSFNSIGIGMAFRAGPFQLYMLTDNLNAAFWPKGTRAVSAQIGLNLSFGCGKRDDYSIINNKKLKKDIDFM